MFEVCSGTVRSGATWADDSHFLEHRAQRSSIPSRTRFCSKNLIDLESQFSQEALLFVAKTTRKDHGDARGLSALSFVLAEAVRHRIERADTPTAQMFFSQRSAPADDRDIMKPLSLIDQLALVAIFEAGKKLVSCLRNFIIAGNGTTIQGMTIKYRLFHKRYIRISEPIVDIGETFFESIVVHRICLAI
jgi:hypothetical protein